MSERRRHPLIELQRAVRRRPLRYAINKGQYADFEIGAPAKHPTPVVKDAPASREEQRKEGARLRNIAKAEASSTAAQRRARDRRASKMLAHSKLEKEVGANVVLHPENPYVFPQLRRKLRAAKGKAARIAVITDAARTVFRRGREIVTPGGIILPGKGAA